MQKSQWLLKIIKCKNNHVFPFYYNDKGMGIILILRIISSFFSKFSQCTFLDIYEPADIYQNYRNLRSGKKNWKRNSINGFMCFDILQNFKIDHENYRINPNLYKRRTGVPPSAVKVLAMLRHSTIIRTSLKYQIAHLILRQGSGATSDVYYWPGC